MRRIAMFLCSVALVGFAVASVSAQTDTPAPDTNTMTDTTNSSTIMGKVVSTSGRTIVVETDAGNRMTFETDTSSLPTGTSVGSRVQIAYSPNENGGVNHASKVTVMSTSGSSTSTADSNVNTYRSPSGTNPDTYGTNRNTGATADTYAANRNTDSNPNMDTNRNMDTTTHRNLPRTGSSLPLIGLLGLVALAGAVGIGILRRSF